MKEITAVKINPTDFAPFGTYCSMTEPEGCLLYTSDAADEG